MNLAGQQDESPDSSPFADGLESPSYRKETGMNESMNRRHFVAATAAAGVGLAMGRTTAAAEADKPALLGGAVPTRSGPFPKWPIANAREEKALLATLRQRQMVPRRRPAGGQV